MSILVVEDNPLTATVLETHLTKQGWVVLRAADGHTALELLEGDPDVELLITDIQMPGMDGLELLQAVRARPEWKTLPVLVATARASAELVTRAGALGVRHLAVKPYNVVQLVQQIREVLRTQPPTLRPRKQVQSVLGLDETAYRGLLRGFGDMAAARQAELDALGSGDVETATALGAQLSDLRESASLVGADRVVAALDAVLASAREMRDVAGLRALSRELQRVRGAVDRAAPQARAAATIREGAATPPADGDPSPDEPGA